MTYQVQVLNFEGPLDLLLQLVERSRLEITDISLAEVTEQFVVQLQDISATPRSDLGQFLALASRLVYIKSQAILPNYNPETEPEVIALRQELADYQQYTQAAVYLNQLLQAHAYSYPRSRTESLAPEQLPMPSLDLPTLAAVFQATIARLPPAPTKLATEQVSQADMMQRLLDKSKGKGASLHAFLASLDNRLQAMVAFLALLELVKDGRLTVEQDELFGDMILRNESPNAHPIN